MKDMTMEGAVQWVVRELGVMHGRTVEQLKARIVMEKNTIRLYKEMNMNVGPNNMWAHEELIRRLEGIVA